MEEEKKTETVPYERFQQVVSERSKLKAELDEARSSLQSHAESATAAEAMRAELDATRAKLAALAVDAGLDTALAERGFDGDGRAMVRFLHGRLPEESRPAIAEWVDGMKEDPSTRPRPLLAYFDAPAPPAPPSEVGTPVSPASPPLPRSGVHSSGEAPAADVTADAIRLARERFENGGPRADLEATLKAWNASRT